jgi:hypothetical protein
MSEARQLVVLPVAVLVPPVAPAAALAEVVEQSAESAEAAEVAEAVVELLADHLQEFLLVVAVAVRQLALLKDWVVLRSHL